MAKRGLLVGVLVWIALSVMAGMRLYAGYQQELKFSLLSAQLEELRHSLSMPPSLKSRQQDRVALSAQIVRSVRYQLEGNMQEVSLSPDMSHFFYSVDRYLERVRGFVALQSGIEALADELEQTQWDQAMPESARVSYYQLAAYMFSALSADHSERPISYQALEVLLLESQQLPSPYREQFQRLLSEASRVLAQHAQAGRLSDELLSPSLVTELNQALGSMQRSQLIIATGWGALSSVLLFGLLVWQRLCIRPAAEPAMEPVAPEEKTESETQLPEFVPPPPSVPAPEVVQEAKHQEPVFDIEYVLDTFDHDQESVNMVLEVFLQDHAEDAAKLKELLQTDLHGAIRTVHSLKGISGNLGAAVMKSMTQDYEQLLRQGGQLSEQQLEELAETLGEVVAQVRSYLVEQQKV